MAECKHVWEDKGIHSENIYANQLSSGGMHTVWFLLRFCKKCVKLQRINASY